MMQWSQPLLLLLPAWLRLSVALACRWRLLLSLPPAWQ
jgi:hypothetical protein